MPKKAIEEVKEKSNSGRKTDYLPQYDDEVEKLALLGYTDEEMAKFFDVAPSTFYLWQKKHEGFSESVKEGRERSDVAVVSALRQRALGTEVEEEHVTIEKGGSQTIKKIKRKIPPDPTSMIYWLNNRQRARWKNRTALDPLDKDGQSISFKVDYADNTTVQPKPTIETIPSGDTEGPETGEGSSDTTSPRKDKSSDG